MSGNRTVHFLKFRESDPAVGRAAGKKPWTGEHEEGRILCKACGNRITTVEHMIAVNGQHRHTFTNPAGVTFRVGCFSWADGCLTYGEPTLEFTWFAGFAWSLAFCSSCSTHLGWYYQAGAESFFGLIYDRLTESMQTH